jgi:uncharacterized membrane protein
MQKREARTRSAMAPQIIVFQISILIIHIVLIAVVIVISAVQHMALHVQRIVFYAA